MSAGATVRLFVGAWLDCTLRERAAAITEELRRSGADVKWVPPENLHVTLRFLGDVPAEDVSAITACVASAVATVPAFELHVAGLGAFPARGRARVVWVGIVAGAPELARLAVRTEKALLAGRHIAAPEKRPFQAHVTLGRPRSSQGSDRLAGLLEELAFKGGTQLLEEVRLVESRLTPRGAIYECVARCPLAGGTRRGQPND